MAPHLYAFIPTDDQVSSMEAFRDAVLNNGDLKKFYQDDLSHLYPDNDEEWHRIFTEYHELKLEFDHVAVGLVSNGHWIDDLQFIGIETHTAIDLGLS